MVKHEVKYLKLTKKTKKLLILFIRALPSWPQALPKALPSITIIFGDEGFTYEIWGDTSIQTLAEGKQLASASASSHPVGLRDVTVKRKTTHS